MNAPAPRSGSLDEVLKVVRENQSFLVVSHICPDGDAVGSTLAMGKILERCGKDVTFFNVDPIPYNFQFLQTGSTWSRELPASSSFDVTIMLDCGEAYRIGQVPDNAWGKTIAVIDHHKTFDPTFAHAYFRDVDAAATGELVYKIGEALGVIDLEIARCLYCCLVTDTGSFRYSNTTQSTFTIAGALVAKGVDPWEMTSQIYENQPRVRLKMLSKALSTLEYSDCGRLAFLHIEEAPSAGDEALTDGFINYARSVQGVEVATQMTYDDNQNAWRISFRSRGRVDVSELASRFGGGGHHNAAGCRIEGSAEDVREQLANALVALLDA